MRAGGRATRRRVYDVICEREYWTLHKILLRLVVFDKILNVFDAVDKREPVPGGRG